MYSKNIRRIIMNVRIKVKPYRVDGHVGGNLLPPQVVEDVVVDVIVYYNKGINDDTKWRVRVKDDRGAIDPNTFGKNDVFDLFQPQLIGYGATPYDAVNNFVIKFAEWINSK
jgi:hypothetical protein